MYQITKQIFKIRLTYIINNKSKTVLQMARPCKLTPEIQQRIGKNIALAFPYVLYHHHLQAFAGI